MSAEKAYADLVDVSVPDGASVGGEASAGAGSGTGSWELISGFKPTSL